MRVKFILSWRPEPFVKVKRVGPEVEHKSSRREFPGDEGCRAEFGPRDLRVGVQVISKLTDVEVSYRRYAGYETRTFKKYLLAQSN